MTRNDAIGKDTINDSEGTAALKFSGVNHFYGTNHAVVDLDLTINRGEFFALLGPSGSGKTTLLMLIAGFESPTNGVLELNGRPANNIPVHRRDIGVVFQNYALFPHMSVSENVAYPLRERRVPRAERAERVAAALDLVKLADKADARPLELSGGQQQRVALARAVVFGPSVLLMDEPLGALDRSLREDMQFELKRIHNELGVTVVYVTHDQGEAMAMADRIGVMHEGHLQQVAAPQELFRAPANGFIARFVGESALRAPRSRLATRRLRFRTSSWLSGPTWSRRRSTLVVLRGAFIFQPSLKRSPISARGGAFGQRFATAKRSSLRPVGRASTTGLLAVLRSSCVGNPERKSGFPPNRTNTDRRIAPPTKSGPTRSQQ
jgi:ABC-type Fe3+/spermidine/putrescine transport system ATPase subunit